MRAHVVSLACFHLLAINKDDKHAAVAMPIILLNRFNTIEPIAVV